MLQPPNKVSPTLADFTQKISDSKTIHHFRELIQLTDFAKLNNKLLAVQGGFAVDLAVGHLTRLHDDLDVVVMKEDLSFFKNFLKKQNYEISLHENMDPTWSFNAYKYFDMIQDRVYIDFDGINIREQEVWDGEGENKFIWPISTNQLFWERIIEEHTLTFLSPYLIYKFKIIQQNQTKIFRDKEIQDLKLLEVVFPDIVNK